MNEPFLQTVFYDVSPGGIEVEFEGWDGHYRRLFLNPQCAKDEIEFWARLYGHPKVVTMRSKADRATIAGCAKSPSWTAPPPR